MDNIGLKLSPERRICAEHAKCNQSGNYLLHNYVVSDQMYSFKELL